MRPRRDPAERDSAFDAVLQQIGLVLESDPILGGLAFGLTYGRPEPAIEAIAARATMHGEMRCSYGFDA